VSVTRMEVMFEGAEAFNQPLLGWQLQPSHKLIAGLRLS
jgi:hypothetical protein